MVCVGVCVLPQQNRFDLSSPPPIASRRCPVCGEPLTVEPTDRTGHDQRTFECTSCAYAETVTVTFSSVILSIQRWSAVPAARCSRAAGRARRQATASPLYVA